MAVVGTRAASSALYPCGTGSAADVVASFVGLPMVAAVGTCLDGTEMVVSGIEHPFGDLRTDLHHPFVFEGHSLAFEGRLFALLDRPFAFEGRPFAFLDCPHDFEELPFVHEVPLFGFSQVDLPSRTVLDLAAAAAYSLVPHC